MPAQPSVYILDDDLAVCRWVETVLGSAGMATASFGRAEEFLNADLTEGPCCLLLDCQLPGMNGLELLRILKDRQQCIAAVMMTATVDVASAVRAIKLGAVDYLEKPLLPEVLLKKVHEAIGKSSQTWIQWTAEQRRRTQLAELTERELEVAKLLATGVHTKQIAKQLDVSTKTVEHHRPRIFDKLGIDSVVELARLLPHAIASEHAFPAAPPTAV